MYQLQTLKNGLTLITVPKPSFESVTTLVAVGTGSRYENKKNIGLAHFLEHMFFKGSIKFPSAEEIAKIVDGIGAINNAFTYKEYTGYWIKSAAKDIKLASDIISSMIAEPLFKEEEIEREKGVIIEERRMYQDNPARWIGDLFFELIFGDTPMGWNVIGTEQVIKSLTRQDFLNYMESLYSPQNMTLVFAGKITPKHLSMAEKYFSKLPSYKMQKPLPFKSSKQTKPRVKITYKKTDQVNAILGGRGISRSDQRKYAASLLASILGNGMSSRLFMQVRERRGLAYRVFAESEEFLDTGAFMTYAGLKLEKAEEGIKVMREELERLKVESVPEDELEKVKEMTRGHLAIRTESTNFLAEYFGLQYVLDREIETPEEYLEKINQVTAADIKKVANDLFQSANLNLQIIGPFRDQNKFSKILS